MSILNNILKTFIGDKTKKDLKNITPLITEIKSFENQLQPLSNDELRAKTDYFKKQIAVARAPFDEKIVMMNEDVLKINETLLFREKVIVFGNLHYNI